MPETAFFGDFHLLCHATHVLREMLQRWMPLAVPRGGKPNNPSQSGAHGDESRTGSYDNSPKTDIIS
ncbi:hypothetical protein [Sulfitobacter sp. THAF37]|uniref:hypothetical protein n=1 Tax=Sulfitobacter sp. THAF37 TaxID=2587855 RepID=UPI001268A009|nr:hypothetical protein [Sulfitobacter sp. THAF37]